MHRHWGSKTKFPTWYWVNLHENTLAHDQMLNTEQQNQEYIWYIHKNAEVSLLTVIWRIIQKSVHQSQSCHGHTNTIGTWIVYLNLKEFWFERIEGRCDLLMKLQFWCDKHADKNVLKDVRYQNVQLPCIHLFLAEGTQIFLQTFTLSASLTPPL